MNHLNICIAGLGNVGANLITTILNNNIFVKEKASLSINVLGISAKNKNKDRIFDTTLFSWFDNPMDLISVKGCNIFIELIGDEKGISFDLIKAALKNKIHVITANKALLSKNGMELFKIAEENNVKLLFEAAVAGGIPVIKTLKNIIFLNNIKKISGIVNGTTNYILTTMYNQNLSFNEVLNIAKSKGYTSDNEAELDIGGLDSAHKLTLLASISFGCEINFEYNDITGISKIEIIDIINAEKLGYKIKLISETSIINNQIYCITAPKLIRFSNPLASVDGVLNAIKIESDQLNTLFLEGEGAGGKATASSILSDLYEIHSMSKNNSLGYEVKKLKKFKKLNISEIKSHYYLRIMTKDIAGVLSKITGYLESFEISIEKILQIPDADKKNIAVPIIITTHLIQRIKLEKAINQIDKQEFILEKITFIPIDKN
jgi:homoserine dehydrogenase